MSQSFKKSLVLELQPSFNLTAGLIVSHAGALVCLLFAGIHIVLVLIAAVILMANCIYLLRRYAWLRLATSIDKLIINRYDCQVLLKNGEEMVAILHQSTVVAKFIIVLRLLSQQKILNVPLCSDIISADQNRQLRVRLKISKF